MPKASYQYDLTVRDGVATITVRSKWATVDAVIHIGKLPSGRQERTRLAQMFHSIAFAIEEPAPEPKMVVK